MNIDTAEPGIETAVDELPTGCQAVAARLAQLERQLDRNETTVPAAGFTDEKLAVIATAIYRARRRRAALFGDALFGEPAWDMLLDLFIKKTRAERMSTTRLCYAADVPPTTGLRWIEKLGASGLLQRSRDPADARVTLVELTREGYRLMRSYVSDGVPLAEMPIAH